MKRTFAFIAAIAALLLLAPRAHAQADSIKTAVIKVTNLHCGNDMPTIKKRLLNTDGIDEVSFTGIERETSVFTIIYHTAATSRQQIEKDIEATPGCDDQKSTPYRVKKDGGKKKGS